ncbi:MAG: ABC transporter ATP-binding protein/permease [Lachnospiraceae bacterium]|nr:ABC transporter ATP-binding protein/permease [Lachnospiraceae bacterium]
MKRSFRHDKRSQLNTLKRVLKRVARYRLLIALSLAFASVSVAGSLYIPVLTGKAVDNVLGPGQVDFSGLIHVLIIMGITVLLSSLFQWLMNICNNHIAFSVVKDIRKEAFAKIQSLPLSYIDSNSHGDMVSRVIADADQFSDGLLMGFTQLFTSAMTILGTLIFMLTINPWITLAVVFVTPLSFFVASFIAKRTYSMFTVQSKQRGQLTSLINEMIGNEKTVLAFDHMNDALQEFDGINSELESSSLKALFFSSLTNPCTRFVNSIVYALVGVTGALAAIKGMLTVGRLVSFLSYANQYTKPFNEISGVVTELQNAIACASRLLALIDEPSQSADPETPLLCSGDTGTKKVEFRDVCFSYNKNRPLIENFNLTARPGTRTAIVGPTGCGKTTLINLLMRFYDTDSGKILIEDNDTKKMKRDDLRSLFGMVLQDTWLKNGTVRENIAMGKPDASDEEIINAAKLSHADSFIRRLENGYDTILTGNGDTLSAGQKQLLCISRLMLALPPMLILDEATSSIDTRTEMKIQDAFAKMMEGRTSFIVAHRLSTIKNADNIIVMKDGHIMEQGTHTELLSKNGFYSVLYNSQFL